jgi:ketosteroid isomerase-like protein
MLRAASADQGLHQAVAAGILRRMAHRNVEIVRSVYEAAARRDTEAVLALYDPEVELDNSALQVVGWGGGVYRGHEGVRRFFREWHEAWDSVDYDFDELIEAPGEHVVAVVTRHARGRASGAEVTLDLALLWTIRDERVVRVVWFSSREEALAAAGPGE